MPLSVICIQIAKEAYNQKPVVQHQVSSDKINVLVRNICTNTQVFTSGVENLSLSLAGSRVLAVCIARSRV